jgi:hypothetical protein
LGFQSNKSEIAYILTLDILDRNSCPGVLLSVHLSISQPNYYLENINFIIEVESCFCYDCHTDYASSRHVSHRDPVSFLRSTSRFPRYSGVNPHFSPGGVGHRSGIGPLEKIWMIKNTECYSSMPVTVQASLRVRKLALHSNRSYCYAFRSRRFCRGNDEYVEQQRDANVFRS